MKNHEKMKTASSVGNRAGGWLPRSWGDCCNAHADETNSIVFGFTIRTKTWFKQRKKKNTWTLSTSNITLQWLHKTKMGSDLPWTVIRAGSSVSTYSGYLVYIHTDNKWKAICLTRIWSTLSSGEGPVKCRTLWTQAKVLLSDTVIKKGIKTSHGSCSKALGSWWKGVGKMVRARRTEFAMRLKRQKLHP